MLTSDRNLQKFIIEIFTDFSASASFRSLHVTIACTVRLYICTALHMYLCTDVENVPLYLATHEKKRRSKLNYHAFSLNIFVAFSMALA